MALIYTEIHTAVHQLQILLERVSREGGFIMAIASWVFGIIGGLCTIMGIITAVDVVPLISQELTWAFWFALSAILLLVSIAFAVSRTPYAEY